MKRIVATFILLLMFPMTVSAQTDKLDDDRDAISNMEVELKLKKALFQDDMAEYLTKEKSDDKTSYVFPESKTIEFKKVDIDYGDDEIEFNILEYGRYLNMEGT